MAYRGTLVTGGSGLAVVIATGHQTEIGQVQLLAGSVEAGRTPMQKQLDQLGRQLAVGAGLSCALTMGIGLLRGQGFLPMLRTAVSLAVAAVPEGLPTVAITTLALGLARMRDQHVIVRRLAAVETLGAVQVVCVDKTGTLTVNRMTVTMLECGLDLYEVRAGVLQQPERGVSTDMLQQPGMHDLLRIGVLCSDVEVQDNDGVWVLRGSPTEAALVQTALDANLDVNGVRAQYPRISTQHRADNKSYMATLHGGETGQLLAVKGRPEEVLALCSAYLDGDQRRPLTDAERARITHDNDRMAGRALRVLGLAFAEQPGDPDPELARDLVWVGLAGMADPPRKGVAEVIQRFRRAGVRTVMLTGDQSATAQAVGREIAISDNGHLELVDSTQLDRIDAELFSALAHRAHVFSRVTPAHKLQIVKALQRAGLVVAMTGDGVNDSPALKASDIGVAMGGAVSNVAREAADVVLEDDELGKLVDAIEQGRTIYDDIRKAVHFILATNLSEILYTLTCVAGAFGESLTPMQLLWINLLSDVFPELALAVEPPESDVLARPPRDPARPMFTSADLWQIGSEGTVITMGALAAYGWARSRSGAGPHAGTVGFTALTFAQLLHAWSVRSETHTIFDRGRLAKNRWMLMTLGGTMGLQVVANLLPPLRSLLGTVRLSGADWSVALSAAVGPFLLNELIKRALRSRHEQPLPAGPAVPATLGPGLHLIES
jgi:Ca2+-transporting ATPase